MTDEELRKLIEQDIDELARQCEERVEAHYRANSEMAAEVDKWLEEHDEEMKADLERCIAEKKRNQTSEPRG